MTDDRLDGLFMNAVQQSQGIDNFFNNLFGFFQRRTDLYSDEANSKKKLNESYEKWLKVFKEEQDRKRKLEIKKTQDKMVEADRKKKEQEKKLME